tara:strand:- start:2088 stop:3128 length:1041 start_codon:yes stop_codon:yes gene_type:complete
MNTNINISEIKELISPLKLKQKMIISDNILNFVNNTRKNIVEILNNKCNKFILIVGPCSIHNYNESLEYAEFLVKMKKQFGDKILFIMRTYFSKPRTTIGWKGFLYDPDLNNTNNIDKGLLIARKLLININMKNIPCSMEYLDTISPQYFDDLISWGAIGARTCESQVHRELASAISTPIGFKNSTYGNIEPAINSIIASKQSHTFLGCNENGTISSITSKGNPYCHIILRGGKNSTNYDINSVDNCIQLLNDKLNDNISKSIIIDCSHDNSNKNYKNQSKVVNNILTYINDKRSYVKGLMIESNLVENKQPFVPKNKLLYGQSLTDSCIGLKETEIIINKIYNSL